VAGRADAVALRWDGKSKFLDGSLLLVDWFTEDGWVIGEEELNKWSGDVEGWSKDNGDWSNISIRSEVIQ